MNAITDRCSGMLLALLVLAAGSLPGAASAQEGAVGLGKEWTPIDPARLASMRGGFQLPGGQSLSFGIERMVFVNGELVASVSVQIPDVTSISPEQALALAEVRKGLVVQVGPGNSFEPTQLDNGVLVQNTLDNQSIGVVTRIQASVDTLGAFQNLNANTALTDALVRVPVVP